MRMKDWAVPVFGLFWCGMVASAGSEPAVSASIAARIRTQEARVPQIEAMAAGEREQVQQWYESRQAALTREIARPEAARLSLAQRELWVQFADLYFQRPYPPACFNAGFSGCRAAVLGNAMIQEYLISEMADLLANHQFERKLTQIVQERLEAPLLPLLREQAAELLGIVRKVQAELAMRRTQLEIQRNASLDAIGEREKDLEEQVCGILEYLRQSESRPVRRGVVESVGYCPTGGYYCMIEGVGKVLGVGDLIGDIRVLRIDAEKVEFAKDGATWTQALGAPARPFWD